MLRVDFITFFTGYRTNYEGNLSIWSFWNYGIFLCCSTYM